MKVVRTEGYENRRLSQQKLVKEKVVTTEGYDNRRL